MIQSRRCVCGHDEDEHVEGIGCDAEVEANGRRSHWPGAPAVFCWCEHFVAAPGDTDMEGSGSGLARHQGIQEGEKMSKKRRTVWVIEVDDDVRVGPFEVTVYDKNTGDRLVTGKIVAIDFDYDRTLRAIER